MADGIPWASSAGVGRESRVECVHYCASDSDCKKAHQRLALFRHAQQGVLETSAITFWRTVESLDLQWRSDFE